MSKLSEIDLGSTLLSTFIFVGYVATALVIIRITIIGINYIKVNFLPEENEIEPEKSENKSKGF